MSPDRSNRSLERIIGSLEEGQENLKGDVAEIKTLLQQHAEKSDRYRSCVQSKLDDINAKVDPILNDVKAQGLTLQAHEAVLASYADKIGKAKFLGRSLKWVGRAAWLLGGGFVVLHYERLKPLIMFWK